MRLLGRLWTGIVGALAGAALAIGVQVAGQMTIRVPIEYLEKLLVALGAIGFVVGFAVGNRKIGAPKDKPQPDK